MEKSAFCVELESKPVTRQPCVLKKGLVLLQRDSSRNASHVGGDVIPHVLWNALLRDNLNPL